MMKTMKLKKIATLNPVRWFYEEHNLPGRTVTIAEVVVPDPKVNGRARGFRGVSIRNPKDCPLKHDGIKYALTRAMERAKLSKARRKAVWSDFLAKYPPHTPKV